MSTNAPLDWPIDYSAATCDSFESGPVKTEGQTTFEEMAVDLLWNWTGGVFGLIPTEVRPVREENPVKPPTFRGRGPHVAYPTFGAWASLGINDRVYLVTCGVCLRTECLCVETTKIALPGPVQSITEVKIDGAVLAPGAYRLEKNRWLVRQDGLAWPNTQDLAKASTEVGTWEVTYVRGIEVPKGGQVAAGLLACELFKAAQADPSCGLPSRVQTVSRQGVTVGIIDSFESLSDGRTGLWVVDAWIASVTAKRTVASVRSVDKAEGASWRV